MMSAIIAAIVMSIAGIAAGLIGTANNRQAQQAHDKEMADIELQNQKKLMDYQVELQQSNNTMATQKGHAIAAGFSPALLYGNMSTPSLQDVNGGSTGASASHLPELNLFDRVPLSSVSESVLQKQSQDIQREKIASEVSLNKQRALESAARTAEQTRYTGLQKQLEKTIIDQSLADLHLTQSRGSYFDSATSRINLLLPYEVEQAGLMNSQTAERTKHIIEDTLSIKANRQLIPIEKRRLTAMAELAEEQKGTPTKEREALSAEIAGMQESFKRSVIGRVMSESGLNGVKLPPSMRGDIKDLDPNNFSKSAFYMRHREQLNGALAALLAAGFSPEEASMAVCYYVVDARDVSPSLINGISRVASTMLSKK